jgi:hypothetical protein
MVNLAVNAGMHAYSERADDLYETPPEAVLALRGAVSLPHRIWEPAAGRGAIVESPERDTLGSVRKCAAQSRSTSQAEGSCGPRIRA